MREFVRRRPVLVFAVLLMLYGYSFFVFLPLAFGVDAPLVDGRLMREYGYMALPRGLSFVPDNPILLLFFGYGVSPSLAGLTVAATGWGRQGIAGIFRRLRPWRADMDGRTAMLGYVQIILLFLAICGLWIAVHLAMTGADVTAAFAGVTLGGFLAAFVIGMTLNPGGVLEEFAGYRGFLLPHLLENGASPLKASLIISVLWIVWHHAVPFSPLLVPRDQIGTTVEFWTINLPIFTIYMIIGNVALSIIMTHFYLKTGSVLAGILIHSGINSVPFGLNLVVGTDSFASASSQTAALLGTGVLAILALVLVALGGLKVRSNAEVLVKAGQE